MSKRKQVVRAVGTATIPLRYADMGSIHVQAAEVIARAKKRSLLIVTAESCTGGALATLFSETPGAGEAFFGGIVCYSKACKECLLGVPSDLIKQESAVSRAVAEAMARGALARTGSDLAVAVTGVAGPVPDEDGNPVGLVHIAVASAIGEIHHRCLQLVEESPQRFREGVMNIALSLLKETLAETPASTGASAREVAQS